MQKEEMKWTKYIFDSELEYDNKRKAFKIKDKHEQLSSSLIISQAIDEKNNLIYASLGNKGFVVINPKQKSNLVLLHSNNISIKSMKLATSLNLLIVGHNNSRVSIWRTFPSLKFLTSQVLMEKNSQDLTSIECSDDFQRFLFGSWYGKLIIITCFNVKQKKFNVLKICEGFSCDIEKSFDCCEKGNIIFGYSGEYRLSLFRKYNYQKDKKEDFMTHCGRIQCIRSSKLFRSVFISGDLKGFVHMQMYSAKSVNKIKSIGSSPIMTMVVAKSLNILFLGIYKGMVLAYDIFNRTLVQKFSLDYTDYMDIFCINISCNSKLLVISGYKKNFPFNAIVCKDDLSLKKRKKKKIKN